jgi:hypothetical protein
MSDDEVRLREFAAHAPPPLGGVLRATMKHIDDERLDHSRQIMARENELFSLRDDATRFRDAQMAWENYGRTRRLIHWHTLQDCFGFASPEPAVTDEPSVEFPRCEHCDRPSPDGTFIMGRCSEECLHCCGSRCIHVADLLGRLSDVVCSARSLTRQVAHVLFEHGDDFEVLHEGMRQSAEWLEERLRALDAFSPAAVKDMPGDGPTP